MKTIATGLPGKRMSVLLRTQPAKPRRLVSLRVRRIFENGSGRKPTSAESKIQPEKRPKRDGLKIRTVTRNESDKRRTNRRLKTRPAKPLSRGGSRVTKPSIHEYERKPMSTSLTALPIQSLNRVGLRAITLIAVASPTRLVKQERESFHILRSSIAPNLYPLRVEQVVETAIMRSRVGSLSFSQSHQFYASLVSSVSAHSQGQLLRPSSNK